MILTPAELDSLIQVRHRSPHQLLGMHPLGDGSGVVVRAFVPNAAYVEIHPVHEKNQPRIKLERLHEAGLFEGISREAKRVYAYDLVITDQTMPRMTGLELTRELLAIRPGLPVVLYTGYADGVMDAQVEAAGVRALLRKPVEPAQLLALLRAHLPGVGRAAR